MTASHASNQPGARIAPVAWHRRVGPGVALVRARPMRLVSR